MGAQARRSMPYRVPLRVSRSGGEKGNSRASDDVSNVRHTATAFRPRGNVESRPSLWRKARLSSLPRVAAKWARAFCVMSLSVSALSACNVTDNDAWNSLSRPRCTSSRSLDTSSRAISASGDMERPRLKERLWADSNLTFCHSRVRAACSVGMAPRCTDRSMGAPAAISPCRKPGASDLGHLPRCRERTRRSPTRMSRRLTSTSVSRCSSRSTGEPPKAAESQNRRKGSPARGKTPSPPRVSSPCSSSIRLCSQTA